MIGTNRCHGALASRARTGYLHGVTLRYQFVELSVVAEDTLTACVNAWVAKGWQFDSIRFVMAEHARRPQMAFVSFVRDDGACVVAASGESAETRAAPLGAASTDAPFALAFGETLDEQALTGAADAAPLRAPVVVRCEGGSGEMPTLTKAGTPPSPLAVTDVTPVAAERSGRMRSPSFIDAQTHVGLHTAERVVGIALHADDAHLIGGQASASVPGTGPAAENRFHRKSTLRSLAEIVGDVDGE